MTTIKSKNKISFIVLSYKQHNELSALLNTLITQTNKNFEVLLIIDVPTQNDFSIIEKYKEELGSKFKLILNSKRQYRSSSIWRSIKIVDGNYVTILSPTDLIDKSFVNTILKKIEKAPADVYEYGVHYRKALKHKVLPRMKTNVVHDLQKNPDLYSQIIPSIFSKVFSKKTLLENKYTSKIEPNSRYSIVELFVILSKIKTFLAINKVLIDITVPHRLTISSLQITRSWLEVMNYLQSHVNVEIYLPVLYTAHRHIRIDLMLYVMATKNKIQFAKQLELIKKIETSDEYKMNLMENKYIKSNKNIKENKFLLEMPKSQTSYESKLKSIY
ncbi:MAG: glycosyltransferase [Mycoplasma sp.]|nr:glycosyltransferase [Mycoplasma sp.]